MKQCQSQESICPWSGPHSQESQDTPSFPALLRFLVLSLLPRDAQTVWSLPTSVFGRVWVSFELFFDAEPAFSAIVQLGVFCDCLITRPGAPPTLVLGLGVMQCAALGC